MHAVSSLLGHTSHISKVHLIVSGSHKCTKCMNECCGSQYDTSNNNLRSKPLCLPMLHAYDRRQAGISSGKWKS